MKRFITFSTIILIFLRFSVPVSALASEAMYQLFLHDQYVESSENLENTRHEITKISADEQQSYSKENEGLVDMAKRIFNSTTESMSINSQIEKYQQLATDTTEHAINIIVVFVLQTIMMPLLFLWLTYRALKLVWTKFLPV